MELFLGVYRTFLRESSRKQAINGYNKRNDNYTILYVLKFHRLTFGLTFKLKRLKEVQ